MFENIYKEKIFICHETFFKKSSVLESTTFSFLPAFDFIFWWVWVLIFSNRQFKSCFKGRICGNKYCNGIDICKCLFDRKSEALQCSCIRDALREKHRKCGNLENFPHTIPSMQFIDILQFYIFQPFLPCQGSLIEVRCCIKYQFSSER